MSNVAAPILSAPPGDPAQLKHLKALHKAAARRWKEFSPDERQEMLSIKCGVPTLSISIDKPFLTKEIALRVLREMNDDRPTPRRKYKRAAPGVIRAMTKPQFAFILHLLDELGWNVASITHWLWTRHRVDSACMDLPHQADERNFELRIKTPLDTRAAHKIITQLQQALTNNARAAARKREAAQ